MQNRCLQKFRTYELIFFTIKKGNTGLFFAVIIQYHLHEPNCLAWLPSCWSSWPSCHTHAPRCSNLSAGQAFPLHDLLVSTWLPLHRCKARNLRRGRSKRNCPTGSTPKRLCRINESKQLCCATERHRESSGPI